MEYIEEGRIKIVEQYNKKDKKKIEKPVLQNGSIVFCKGHDGTGSFYGIVYENGVLELECGSDAYIKTREKLHNSIEYLELQCIVNNRIHDYVSKYHNYPKYIKLPLWIFECLKQTMCEVDLKIDYKTEEFTFFNLKVCETVSIEKTEEIEVF